MWLLREKLLILTIMLALFLRIWGFNWGLMPGYGASYHSDENLYVNIAIRPLTLGHYQRVNASEAFHTPRTSAFFLLLTSIFYLVNKFCSLFNLGFLSTIDKVSIDSLIVGRIVSGLISTFSVAVIYLIGKKLYNRKIGLWSALFLSVTFLDVMTAHYTKEDVYTLLAAA